MSQADADLVRRVRAASGIENHDGGPDDRHIVKGVKGFARAFDYWYTRFLEEKAVPQYRSNVVARINPFIRPIDCHGLNARESTERIVDDYTRRNFVTASGWAIEELAVSASPEAQKSLAEGLDIQRVDQDDDSHHFYVVKSGPITRNSDILNALKRHAREAEGRLRQSRGTGTVIANYVVAYGKLGTTTKDGVRRPASAQFWSEMLDLPPEQAVVLLAAIAAEAPNHMRHAEVNSHIEALKVLVSEYISRADSTEVDWEFLAKRNMLPKSEWKVQDWERHRKASDALKASGYRTDIPTQDPSESPSPDI